MSLVLSTTEAADNDIRDVASYLAIYNPDIARQFEAELWDAFVRVRYNPEIGALLSGYSQPVRFLRVSQRFRKYLVFYRRVDETSLQVVRVLHGARDLTSLLAEL